MARFINTISYTVNADSAQDARRQADEVLNVGTSHNYFRDAVVVSVEAVAEPIYTQAEFDAAVTAAAANARANALAGKFEG